MTISSNNPQVANSTSITLSVFASGPVTIERITWTSLGSSGSIHLTDMRGSTVFTGIGEAAMNIIDSPTVFPNGLRFASMSGSFDTATSATSSTAMEVGKLFVWVR
jgi:hypothetical protein